VAQRGYGLAWVKFRDEYMDIYMSKWDLLLLCKIRLLRMSKIRSLWLFKDFKERLTQRFGSFGHLSHLSNSHSKRESKIARSNWSRLITKISVAIWSRTGKFSCRRWRLSDCSWRAFFLYSRASSVECRPRVCYWSNLELGLRISVVKWNTEICV